MRVSALILTASLFALSASEGPFSDVTFDQALLEAKRSNKIVMVDFFTTWCVPCKKLEQTTWHDPTVIEWLNAKCVALKIDAEKETELAKRFAIKGYPTILFVKPDGNELGRLVGYRDGKKFIADASNASAGKPTSPPPNPPDDARQQDPMARSEYADELVAAKRYDEALKEYLWCFDEGVAARPSYSGVRRSFLLGDIVTLGEVHPPALVALRQRRDAAEARIDAGSTSVDDVADACALSRELGEPERILALYDRVRNGKPLKASFRVAFGRNVLKPLVHAQRYGEVLEVFDKPEGYVKWIIDTFAEAQKPDGEIDEERRAVEESLEPSLRAHIAKDASVMYEAVLGAGRDEMAARIADSLLAFANFGSVYAELVDRAIRAQNFDVARALADRGIASLPADEQPEVRQARDRIPTAK